MFFDQLGWKVWAVCMNALHGLGNGQPFAISPNDLAPLGVDIGFLQHRPNSIGHIPGKLAFGRVHPFEKALEEGIVLDGMLLLSFAHEVRIPLPGQGLRASFILRRLCSMLKATHAAVKALKRL